MSFILRWKNGISIHVCYRSFPTRKLRSDFFRWRNPRRDFLLGRWVLQTIWWTEELGEKRKKKRHLAKQVMFFRLGRPAWFVFFPQDDANGCQWTAWEVIESMSQNGAKKRWKDIINKVRLQMKIQLPTKIRKRKKTCCRVWVPEFLLTTRMQ